MKTLFTVLLLCAAPFALFAQTFAAPDTLVNEVFETDPTPFMLDFPSGEDEDWVNYDADQAVGFCVEPPDDTPGAWFWDGDLGIEDSDTIVNNVFTSCSWLENAVRAQNWLILPPTYIPDSSYWLSWRSLTFEGPAFVDGYKVMVSTGSNDPAAMQFAPIFKAAETVAILNGPSLDLDDYTFSEGYIHANGFTDTDYFFIDTDDFGNLFYRGKLEPHAVSLKDYAEQTIYVAFLHDSRDDNLLQIDDILVANSISSSVFVPQNILSFGVSPNPVRDAAYFSWKMKTPQGGHLSVADNLGKVVLQKTFSSREEGRAFFEVQHLAPGVYHCTLETSAGRATTKLVKM